MAYLIKNLNIKLEYNYIKGDEDINILNIKTFLSIVETNSFVKTAEKLFVSQSTISYRLNELEQELGVKLISREQGKRNISLTPDGEDFIALAERWISLENNTEVWKNKDNKKYRLNIGSVDSLNTYIFAPLYKKILQNNSSISLKIGSHWSITVYNLLKSYEIDVGLVLNAYAYNFSNIDVIPLFSEELVVVSNNNSDYGDIVHPLDLDPKKEILSNWGNDVKAWHDNWFPSSENKNLIVDTAGLLFKAIYMTDYWSVVPVTIANDFKNILDIKISKIADPKPERICYMIKNRNHKVSSKKQLQYFEEQLYLYIKDNPYLNVLP